MLAMAGTLPDSPQQGGSSSHQGGSAPEHGGSRSQRGGSASQHGGSTSRQSDNFGMLGLLLALRRDDPWDLLNMDLTTMGLDPKSRCLYKTFASPWADAPLRGDEPEFATLPACYNVQEVRPLQAGHYSKLEDRTLFYIFFSAPGDEAQLYAAEELSKRSWMFNKEIKTWMQRVKIMEMDPASEYGNYLVVDPATLKIVNKDDFLLYYEMLEDLPVLPPQKH